MDTEITIFPEAVSSLQELIDLNTHSHVIYRYAAEHIHHTGIQAELNLIAEERAAQACGLERIIERFEPAKNLLESPPRAEYQHLHPCWNGVKHALGGEDTYLTLEELEKGEFCIESVYEEVLALALPASVHLMVEAHAASVGHSHRRLIELCNAAKPRD